MAKRLFPNYPANPAFGKVPAIQNAGEYILQKKAKRSYCNISLCKQLNNVTSQSDLLLLKKSNYLYNKCVSSSFNKSNLNINLYTKLVLNRVKVIANSSTGISPTPIDVSLLVTPNLKYTIDPCGELFGNTVCGINNYQNFIVYNPPYGSINARDSSVLNNNNIFNCSN